MPYAIKDLDEGCIFLCACLMNAQENGGNLNVSTVVRSLGVNKNWANAFLREAKKISRSRANGEAATDDGGVSAAAVVEANQGAKMTKRKAEDEDEDEENGKLKTRKVAKEKKSKAKKVKVEEEMMKAEGV